MYKLSLLIICANLCGCQYSTVSHMSAQGAMTQNTDIAFLTRGHTRIQAQTGSANPLPPAEPVIAPNTASNTTGLEGILNAQTIGRGLIVNESQTTLDNNGKSPKDFFVYDSDNDSEPAVRAIRIGTVGLVAGKVIK